MMKFSIITIFPEAFNSYFNSSILKKAQDNKKMSVRFFDPRDFVRPAKGGADKHKVVDDRPFGGGPGMVFKAEPILEAVNSALGKPRKKHKTQNTKRKIIILSARGKQFNFKMAAGLAKKYDNIILISGRYEGIDERVKKILKAEEISIGPYILTGGELPAMVVVDAVSRHITGVLGKNDSLEEKHGSYPVYTRPEVLEYKDKKYRVPKVLMSGDHKKIQKWRKKNSLRAVGPTDRRH